MDEPIASSTAATRLGSGIVVRVHEDLCEVVSGGRVHRVRYATHFPTPRVERLSPGHLVATAEAPDGADVVIWRWYDAVVLGEAAGLVRLWEPAHGEVSARRRHAHRHPRPGTRAYLSAGLPGGSSGSTRPTTCGTPSSDRRRSAHERDQGASCGSEALQYAG